MTESTRIESDSLGEVRVPADALYGAQTQRAVENFRISALRMPPAFVHALADVKRAAAHANTELGLLPGEVGAAIATAAADVASGQHDGQFVVDVFQTGSGTSTNMNMNEVLARLAQRSCGRDVHPNDDVNRCQSSNDVIPTALRVAVVTRLDDHLDGAIATLIDTIERVASAHPRLVKTGRTHLMDAMPMRVADELGAWRAQVEAARAGIARARADLLELPLGGTAVGTGINAHPEFAERAVAALAASRAVPFVCSSNRFRDIAGMDAPLAVSAGLRALAVVLLKIANDLRWMNSGPVAGLGEIELEALQPGSSIMPGKVNPVIAEAVAMVAAQVIGADATVCAAAQSGSFQLNVMQPVVAWNLLHAVELLGNACTHLATRSLGTLRYRAADIEARLSRNAMLVTALAPEIGYEQAAAVAKEAAASGRPLIDVALELTSLDREVLEEKLNPLTMAGGGMM